MILSLDTTTPQASVAVWATAGELLSVRRARVTTHSETLLGLIDEVLVESGRTLADVLAIACAAGPGSFTGLRIGLATAKGLCFAAAKPLVLVSSLQAMALRAPLGALAVPCLDAYKGEVFAGLYRSALPPLALREERVLPPARLAAELLDLARREVVVLVGDGPVRWPELRLPGILADDVAPPDAVDVARLAAARLAQGSVDDLEHASPHYIRPSEPELVAQRLAEITCPPDKH